MTAEVLSHLGLADDGPGRSRMLIEPPIFHFQPDHPTAAGGFCLFGRWAPTTEGIAVVEISISPSCWVIDDGMTRRRTLDEVPQSPGGAGINSDALRLVRLIDIREALHRAFLDLQAGAPNAPAVAAGYLRDLLERYNVQEVPPERRRGRPIDQAQKHRRSEEVIAAFSEGPWGARKRIAETWEQVNTTTAVGSEIRRLLQSGWLERNPTDEGGRYAAGPALIAARAGSPYRNAETAARHALDASR